ncbi:MAG: DNA polymerase IV [Candidatus Heimdallarchaeaceae archaeon]
MVLANQLHFSEKEQYFDSIILYMDLDAFFAAVETRENPKLAGKPLIVGGNPKTKKGVVNTCSYEARKFGIKSGMPVSQAFELCPHLICVKGNYTLYSKVSRNIMNILQHYSPIMSRRGIDEAYLDLSKVVSDYNEAKKLALELKDDISASERLTCSVGIAPTRVLAKIASETDKPDGLVIVKPIEIRDFLEPLKISIIPGIGKKTSQVFEKQKIFTCGDLAQLPYQLVYQKWGKYGLKIWKLVNGYNTESLDGKIEKNNERKSISEERTFFYSPKNWEEIWKQIDSSIHTVAKTANDKRMHFKTITLKIRFSNFETFTRSHSLLCHEISEKKIREVIKYLLQEFTTENPQKIRLIGVKISNLKKITDKQKTLTQYIYKQ